MLTREIAKTIVTETSLRLNRNVNIMNEKGVIIGSGDAERMDQIHEGALEVLKTKEPLAVYKNDDGKWRGTHPGLNLPISFQNQVVGVIGITGNPDEMNDVGGLVKMTTELMIKQEFIARQLEWKQRTKEMIIEELLRSVPSYEQIERGMELIELKLPSPYTILIVQISNRSIPNHELIQRIERSISHNDALIGFINVNTLFIGLCGTREDRSKKLLNYISSELNRLSLQYRVAVSNVINTFNDFSQAYQDCKLALEIVIDQQLIFFADVEPQALLHQTNSAEAVRFRERIVTNTVAKYASTLTTFFENNLNIQQTSEAMFIHRNTLVYRLNKITKDTGYDPREFRAALTLQMALWMPESRD
ncbi:CdaR family transcriptional regulator [Guptibacillus algicola]|uniref:CdaR family transcriptional regulator n=1 Tax=Guptibacillus algicola TaxID=225844 RepID=UPI001CD5C156|nr:sugar diacid recognition domain-containing protein [Alkalihalobacillus algicola]MCA0987300.1 helix-turn-helix domain-containing protein [Alkalihalobacillus algicola]